MKIYYETFSIPLGQFTAAVDEQGALVGAGFGGKNDLPRLTGELIHDPKRVTRTRRELEEYFNGKRQKFTLTIAPQGTPFQKSVWAALQRIPFGQTRTYGEIAREVRCAAPRAVGQAVGSNRVCPIIPCHRVVATGGSLGGFYYGLKMKRGLLQLEDVRELNLD